MNLLHKVEEAMMQYGGSSRRSIGDFILKEKNDLHKYSLQEIAGQTYTSKAAVVRFAQALGFSGWKEFVKAFTLRKSSPTRPSTTPTSTPTFPSPRTAAGRTSSTSCVPCRWKACWTPPTC